jgi:Tol biopolymer transport system component/tRNA A-37 threonylcarbamoyl transferase component Bud32
MGEVYKGLDTRLNRKVAIKLLSNRISDRQEVKERFEREAKTIAGLSHPHICTLYDIGHHEDGDYLVMEYIEGETLADRLEKGPLPMVQVLKLALEIADALGKAHRSGVIHRDIKPGNVMLTKSGAKLLDFGLAKLKGAAGGQTPSISMLPTNVTNLSAQGIILGTLQYMAPEQLEGQEADARADIFAFGAMVYEMATGKKAFEGKSQASVIAAILEREPPPMSNDQSLTPVAVDRLIAKCLAKDPDERWESAGDLATELAWILGNDTGAASVQKPRRKLAPWIVAAAMSLISIFALARLYIVNSPTEAVAKRFQIFAPEDSTGLALGAFPAISPDGRQLVVQARDSSGLIFLWSRPLDSVTARKLDGTDGAAGPFWSPDSRFIAFFARGKLFKIAAAGGTPVPICDAPDQRGGTWNSEGVIIFAPRGGGPLYRVSAAGGTPAQLTTLNEAKGEGTHRFPQFLPDGRHFIFVVRGNGQGQFGVHVGSLDSKETKFLVNTFTSGVYAPPGYLVYNRNLELNVVQKFDVGKMELIGEPIPLTDMVDSNTSGRLMMSVSDNGTMVSYPGDPLPKVQLTWRDRTGKRLGRIGSDFDRAPELSPDGKTVVVDRVDPRGGQGDLWKLDLTRVTETRLTTERGLIESPIWSPDGSYVAYVANQDTEIYRIPSSGGQRELLFQSGALKDVRDWSPDGKYILFYTTTGPRRYDLWALPIEGTRMPLPLVQTNSDELHGRFSPDGKWMAYTSDKSGIYQIYVSRFPDGTHEVQVSTDTGMEPRWRHDGKELFYIERKTGRMMSVSIQLGATAEPGVAKPLFTPALRLPLDKNDRYYSVTADGQRFLLTEVPEPPKPAPMTVILNWTSTLAR